MTSSHGLQRFLEAVLFVADEPVPTLDLAVLFEVPASAMEKELSTLADDLVAGGRGVVLRQVAGGWRLSTHPDAAEFLERFVGAQKGARLSRPALETLAIVAYRQPISRGQLAEIRGVSCDGVLRTLLSRGVVTEVGRDPGPGQAILYGTTPLLLEKLGLDSLEELPSLAEFMPDGVSVEAMEKGLGPGL